MLIFLGVFYTFLHYGKKEGMGKKERLMTAGIGGLVCVQNLWITSFLPLTASARAAFGVLIFFAAKELSVRHFSGEGNARLVIKEASVLVGIVLVLLISGSWGM